MRTAFDHGETTLSGVLTAPADTPHAGLVFLHGSGPADAAHWSAWAEQFAQHRIACFSYDKPGVGGSSGDWMRQSFDDRAGEALAAVRHLRRDPALTEAPVGVLGMSQGAWIGPHAASLSDDVALVVALSGSSSGPRRQDRYRVEHELARDGFREADVTEALRVWDECDALFRRGVDDSALNAAVEAYRDRDWFGYFVFADPRLIPLGRLIWDYEPLPFIERCRCPLLAVWGSEDALVDAAESRSDFARTLERAGNDEACLVTIEGADHGLRLGNGERSPDLLTKIAQWLVSVTATSPAASA